MAAEWLRKSIREWAGKRWTRFLDPELAYSASDLSCSRAGAPDLEYVDLPGGLVDVEAAMDQIAAITMVDFAAHQIREKQPPLLKLGEW